MSRLAELIAQLCPDGVEYRPLGEIGSFVRGGGLQKTDFVEQGKPCVHYGQIHTRFGIFIEEAVALVSDAQYDRLKRADYGDLLIATTSEDDEAVGKATAWLGSGEVAISGDMFYFRHSLDPKYVSYFFASSLFQEQKRPYLTGAKVRRISDKGLSRVRIPVPPLEVQREIVRILDRFTTLEAELEAELKARQTQYEHYRNHLLSYASLAAHGRVKWCALGDLVRICNGRDYKALSAGDVPVYGSGGVMTYVSDYLSVGPTVLIPRKGSLDNIYFVEGRFWTVDTIFYTEIDDALHPKFFFHYMKQMKLSRMNEAAGVPSMTQRKLSSIRIPIPSYEEQQRIADLLDRFDALVNDISSGLPAEIAARRAQYEHYRDRLLSFPEKAVSGSDAS